MRLRLPPARALLWGAALCAVLGAGLALQCRRELRQERAETAQRLDALALQQSLAISNWLEGARIDLRAAAVFKRPSPEQAAVFRAAISRSGCLWIQRVDRSGRRIMGAFREGAPEARIDAASVAKARISPHGAVFFRREGAQGRPYVDIALPAGGAGALFLRRDPGVELFRIFHSAHAFSATAENVIFRRMGGDVQFLFYHHGEGIDLRVPVSTANLAAAKHLRGEKLDGTEVDYRGRRVLAVAHPVSGTDWNLLAKVDDAEISSPILRRYLLYGLTLASGLGGLLMFFFRSEALHADEEYAAKREIVEKTRVLDAFFRFSTAPIVSLDRDLNILRVNDAYAKVSDGQAGDFAGRAISEFHPPMASAEMFRQAARSKTPFHAAAVPFEFAGHPERGTTFWDWTLVPLLDSAGEVDSFVLLMFDASARVRDEEARARLAAMVEGSDDAIIGKTLDGTITSWNEGAHQLYGWTAAEAVGKNVSMLIPPGTADGIPEILGKIRRGEHVLQFETNRRRKDGRVIRVSLTVSPVKDRGGAVVGASAVARDVTQRYEAERAVARLTRSMRTLSQCNEALVRAKNESELLERVCRLIVEQGGYHLAWVGMRIDDAARSVKPVAQAGYEEGYLEGLNITWADEERGRGPTGTAIRDGTVEICRDFQRDPRMAPWREEALKRGYRASIALPLRTRDRILGALMIYTDEPDAFSDEEIPLLRELSEDLSYGIAALRERAARSLAEEGLREANAYNRSLIEASMDPLVMIGVDGLIADVNRAMLEAAGRAREEVLGTAFSSYVTKPAEAQAGCEKAVREGAVRDYPLEILARDGRVIPVLFNATAYRDAKGSVRGVLAAARDMTELNRVQEARHRTEILYRRLFESAHDGILIVDSESGKILDVNPALLMLFGCSEEDCVGRPLWDFEPFKAAAAANPNLRGQAARGQARHEDLTMLAKDGREIPVELTITLYTVDGGVVLQYTVRDMSESKRLQAQILHGQKMESVGLLAGGIAHDLNNILMVILGNASFLLSSLGAKDPRRADVEEIQLAEERAAALTRQLLIFSRKQALHPVVLELNDLIRNLQKMLGRIIGEDVKLELELSPEPVAVRADAGQLEQVIMNLSVNARDAMPHGGRLSIRTSRPKPGEKRHPDCAAGDAGQFARLEVSDTGTGMSPEVLAHVFEPFFTTKPAGKGTGLGLSTAYGVVRQAGGGISARSVPGKGTTFTIDLPLSAASAAAAAAPETSAAPPRGRETILLVEDDDLLRRIDQRLLQERGYRVLPARDGEEALNLLHNGGKDADLLLTDVVMPGISGGELAREAMSLKPGLKVIFVSGYVDHRELEQLMATKSEFLQKPVAPEALVRKVREVLDRPAPAASV